VWRQQGVRPKVVRHHLALAVARQRVSALEPQVERVLRDEWVSVKAPE
jgi:hypothetical protein